MSKRRHQKPDSQATLFQVDSPRRKFHLPWLNQWREDFLECSRILSRARHADEAAQRVIYRLRQFLESKGHSMDDIKVLTTVTTPAMLLASAIHRWWPTQPPPALADMGYYMMLSSPKELPVIVRSGKVVVVQDVIDTHRVSGQLVKSLQRQGVEVSCVLGLVHMVDNLPTTRATPVNYWWVPEAGDPPHHAMIEVRRPRSCPPPRNAEEDAEAYWIEPRSLHPFKYKTLRRDFSPGRDPYLDRRDEYLQLFDNSSEGCLLTAGHYVYGQRHYAVTVDLRRTLTGEIGEDIARWLANVCEGRKERKEKWESPDGFNLSGDVTAVLMPLQSQIHYIWPRVENLLAQRGRRQPNWWLESTLFTGTGSYDLLPAQLIDQIQSAVREAIKSKRKPSEFTEHPLRILIIDDAIASARTAENVLTTILREVRKAFINIGAELGRPNRTPEQCPKPIEWIRYFAVLNQMDNARHAFWHSIQAIGRKQVQIVFEEYAPFLGVPIYDDKSCPACRDIIRHKHLKMRSNQHAAEDVRQWVDHRLNELRPVAIDSPDFRKEESVALARSIEVVSSKSRPAVSPEKYRFLHADAAIWRFYELMYLSYPPNDVLQSLDSAWSNTKKQDRQAHEYERYRWAVFEWCLHNWPRIRANAAENVFIKYAKKEVRKNTPLVERIVDGASVHYRDPFIIDFIAELVARMGELERQREEERASTQSRDEQIARLERALTIFFLNIPADELKEITIDGRPNLTLLNHLDNMARSVNASGHSFLRNIFLSATRPQRYAKPIWAMEALAESLFRGRDPDDAPAGNHELLPKLLSEVRGKYVNNPEKRRLLRGSLAVFLGALEDIKHFSGWEFSANAKRIEHLCSKVLDWLKFPPDDEEYEELPGEIHRLEDALDLDGEFCSEFNEIFHKDVESFMRDLMEMKKEAARLDFDYKVDNEVKKCRLLSNIQGLRICLANRAIDPIKDKGKRATHKTRIEVGLERDGSGADRIRFKLLTNFETLEETIHLTAEGPSGKAERSMLETFGARFGNWVRPNDAEVGEGFTASCEISTLTGFVPRSLRK